MLTNIKTRTRVTRTCELHINGSDIITALNEALKNKGIETIPADADVEFHVPGGGDYSNCELDIDDRNPVHIKWTVEEGDDLDS